MQMAHNTVQLLAVENTVTNLKILQNEGDL